MNINQRVLAFLFRIKLEDKLNLSNSTLSMRFKYKLCTGLCALLSAERHQHFHRLFIVLEDVVLLNPESAKKKKYLKMSSAKVVCCKKLPNITDGLSIEANSVDLEQTAPIGAV